MFGLIKSDIQYITSALEKFDEIKCGIIFGSRAMGNYKRGSDIDLAIKGEGINSKTLYKLSDLLNEVYPLPYFFDIVHYEAVSNTNLKSHIDNEGKIIYKANSVNHR
ncbi:nucleotidyltransferase domain-containing protein [Aquibacillus sp. 3ASR75-11]|uniref:Nucleotidyltransferase domain-containing protein n=1 Tax=Terrihalobacillus insolitus TaxID=2950438 RepID=A0A9X3WV30_9BACI|nr:nucleotidyltransferase domain-containing protein [Terrihalobacillus insolitus]MDC3424591.1 nucleotidyltransferase domain-containing protein [Terrihalobacillus insolitus]